MLKFKFAFVNFANKVNNDRESVQGEGRRVCDCVTISNFPDFLSLARFS